MSEFYFKVIEESQVDKFKLALAEKVEKGFRKLVKEKMGIELQEFNLRWVKPITEKEYNEANRYERIFKLISELGGPEVEEKAFVEEGEFWGLFRKKHAFSLRKAPKRFIYLRADLPAKDLAKTFLHELFHCLQDQIEPNKWPSEAQAREAEGLLIKILNEVEP